MITLSVVIPAYNIEPFIAECLESLLSLQSDEVEFICVAGNSSDATSDILYKYANRDKRISVLKQHNTGLSEARNLGADAAKGDYLLFADGDDFVKPNYFRELFERIKCNSSTEVFVTDFCMVMVTDGKRYERPIYQITAKNDGKEGLSFLPEMLKKKQCFWNVWRYVYKRSFLERNNITFQDKCMSEDLDWTNNVLLAKPNIMFLHCPFYCYRIARLNSLMNRVTSRRINDTVAVLTNCIKKLNISDYEWKQNLIEQYQFELLLVFVQLYEVPTEECKEIESVFCNALPLLNLGKYGVAKIAYYICSVIGIKAVALCLVAARQIKRKSQRIRYRWVK